MDRLHYIRYGEFFEIFRSPNLNNMTWFMYEIFKDMVMNLLYGANYLAILDLMRGYSYGLGEVKDKVVHYLPVLLPVAAVFTLITNLVGIVPIIGGVIGIILSYAFIPVYFLIEDYPGLQPLDYFRLSFELTKGHKLSLFIISVLIKILPYIIFFALIITMIPAFLTGIGFVLMIPLILLFFIPQMAMSMLIYISNTIYYEENIDKA